MKVVLALLAPALASLALLLVTTGAVGRDPPETAAARRSVYWGSRLFLERDELARWLSVRGASYTTWAKRHPRAAARHARPLRPTP